ncbi:helix-turn-helix transcriptional regulator [Luteolibacter ambystomatis]|uniref:Helix-turn-helix transcriptional regulator n=1 Tax=Luteolibacter ambystomatis TaxID=2824561 RepID=A0A975PG71_9BACT|nr:helix-turn-helix domain-containing protein [Luteolibacter ambystomatis]QUE52031.1 helix-turn-helix transcriptional regulator [Luteolibacter ambystomatis]
MRAALDVLRGRWKPSILWELKDRPRRFSDIQCALEGASAQSLTLQLRQLEADEVIIRTIYPEIPVRVEYHLSEHGRTLAGLMDQLELWGQAHLARKTRSGGG